MNFYWKYDNIIASLLFGIILLTSSISKVQCEKLLFVSSEEVTTESQSEVNTRNLQSGKVQTRSRLSDNECNCTSLFQCDLGSDSGESISSDNEAEGEENGANVEVIDIRNGMPNRSSANNNNFQCGHYLEICCNRFQNSYTNKQPARANNRVNSPEENERTCGKRNINGVGFRIVGGIEGEAQMGEFPWMVAVTELNKERQGSVYLCGGSLLHPRVIATAAHCIHKKSVENLRIRAGEWDTNTEREDPFIHYDRPVNQTIIHEDYSKRISLKNDIALIVLSKEVPMARHIGTICLTPDLKPPPGSNCVASGWGKNLYGKEGSYQSILKKIDLPVIPQDECQERLRETRLGQNFTLHRSFVCAGGERGKDTCKGDGGSPLVCKIPGSDRYALYGLVSWGLNCGDPIPAAYSNAPYFFPWIERKFRELGLDTSSFTLGG